MRGDGAQLRLSDGKRPSCSGSAFVDVMQPVQDRARPHWTCDRAGSYLRCLQSERAMRPVLVVVGHEFAKHRQQVVLIQDNQVVEALAA
jgi:hypothetical protein